MAEVVTRREINRSYLARQLLLERVSMPVIDAVEHLVGLQAQDVLPPYVGLWSRLIDFIPAQLSDLLGRGELARLTLMRGTVHLVSKRDALRIRPLTQPEQKKAVAGAGPRKDALAGIDLDELATWGRRILTGEGTGMSELRAAAARGWPGRDSLLVGQSALWLLPVTQVTPRGMWRNNARSRWALADTWLGEAFDDSYPVDDLILRYIQAFGSVTTADMQTWSRLTGLRPAIERLRPRLRTLRDESGREMLDDPDAPWPDPETPAPVRFLGAFDNLWLSHKDRSRVMDEAHRQLIITSNGVGRPTILVDGFVAGRYRLKTQKDVARMEIERFRPLSGTEMVDVEAEGARLLRFLEPERQHEIGFDDVFI